MFHILGVEPNEEFTIVSPGFGNLSIVKKAYITENLHLIDKADGKIKNEYILNLLRGILKVRKAA